MRALGVKMAIIIICFVLSALAAPVTSEEFSAGAVTGYRPENVILIDGKITSKTKDDFRKVLSNLPKASLLALNSPGGTVATAIDISKIVHEKEMVTVVPENSLCASACSIIFFAGNKRIAMGELGVHQMSSTSPAALIGVQFLLAEILSIFDRYQVHQKVVQKMLRTPPEKMYYFSGKEKNDWNIDILTPDMFTAKKYSFEDFLVTAIYSGKVILPNFEGRDKWARRYRTRIREGMKKGVNFSGKYAVIEVGCGTSCRHAYLADVSNGTVYRFPYGGETNWEMTLVYSADSSFLRASWRGERKAVYDENGDFVALCIVHDLHWNGKEFVVLDESSFETNGYCNS